MNDLETARHNLNQWQNLIFECVMAGGFISVIVIIGDKMVLMGIILAILFSLIMYSVNNRITLAKQFDRDMTINKNHFSNRIKFISNKINIENPNISDTEFLDLLSIEVFNDGQNVGVKRYQLQLQMMKAKLKGRIYIGMFILITLISLVLYYWPTIEPFMDYYQVPSLSIPLPKF